ncbi:hypothetical protein D0466_01140 [Peribacillus glennii]|uniref:Uncharacterized protein n=1 Tax=Peribacillus glennii TaxID=2303991 RepID=A0A372LJY5_9BACI|nr:hypothetical protein D0466_01140 [Peribacillus glennii]
MRYAWNDPTKDKIHIFIESVLYGLFDYSLRHKPTDADEQIKFKQLLIHTIAHEYHHSVQKEQGVDMGNLTQQHEDDCDRFADDFITKYFS